MSAIGPMPERLKRAELASRLGPAVLGAGVALLPSEFLKPHAIAIAAVGLATHAWGMTDKRSVQEESRASFPCQRADHARRAHEERVVPRRRDQSSRGPSPMHCHLSAREPYYPA